MDAKFPPPDAALNALQNFAAFLKSAGAGSAASAAAGVIAAAHSAAATSSFFMGESSWDAWDCKRRPAARAQVGGLANTIGGGGVFRPLTPHDPRRARAPVGARGP